MQTIADTLTLGGSPDDLVLKERAKSASGKNEASEAFAELERGVGVALETYSNVHRGSGHNSMVTTHLYEQARGIVLEYLGLDKNKYTVVKEGPAHTACTTKGPLVLCKSSAKVCG